MVVMTYRFCVLTISNFAIVAAKGVYYGCTIHDVRKSEAILLLKNYVLDDHGYI